MRLFWFVLIVSTSCQATEPSFQHPVKPSEFPTVFISNVSQGAGENHPAVDWAATIRGKHTFVPLDWPLQGKVNVTEASSSSHLTTDDNNVRNGSMTSASFSARAGSMTSASSTHNLAGCPKLAENCNFDCLDIGNNGCIECTCTKDSPVNGNVLTSAHSALNSNGCPSFPSNCDPSCARFDSNGCPVCQCSTGAKNSNTTSASQASTSSSMTSSNLNGCPPFSPGCSAECVRLDANGCPVCKCQALTTTNFGVGTNNNGCPPFPVNCRTECVSLDDTGCPLCGCTDTTNASSMTSLSHLAQGSNGNLNGCPAYSSNCPPRCTTTDDEGCPTCNCLDSLTSTECRPMVAQCHIECLHTDEAGCVLCMDECNELISKETIRPTATTTVMTTGTGKGGTGSTIVACQAFDGVHCNPICIHLDTNGCLTCDCNNGESNITATTPAPALPNGGYSTTVFPGLTKASTGSGSSSTGNNNGCQVFNTRCDPRCVNLDTLGCLTCSCDEINSTQIPLVPGSGSYITTFAPNGKVTGTSSKGSNSGSSNTNGCPPFDITCPAGCAVLDAIGCLACNCAGTTNATTGSGSGASNGGGNAAGCPAFDTGCPTQCVIMNSVGCVSCSCSGSTNSSTTSAHTVNAGCPRVDVLSCQPSCLSVDVHGCVHCTCPATTTQSSTTGHSTAQTSTAHPSTSLVTQPSSNASFATRPVTQTLTTAPPTQQVPQTSTVVRSTVASTNPASTTYITQTCPRFDETCPHKCITIDAEGCLRCTCTATSSVSTPSTPEVKTTKTAATTATETISSTRAQQTTPPAVQMCPPIRCVYPCNAGVTLGTDHCPICQCQSTTSLPIVV